MSAKLTHRATPAQEAAAQVKAAHDMLARELPAFAAACAAVDAAVARSPLRDAFYGIGEILPRQPLLRPIVCDAV
jgi:hypothetical protein